MSFYRVELNGTNILMPVEGVQKKLGFIIVRIVESNTATLAGELAIQEVEEMQEYKETVLDQSLKEPMLKVREVEQIVDTQSIGSVSIEKWKNKWGQMRLLFSESKRINRVSVD